jgi:hypothetical protein
MTAPKRRGHSRRSGRAAGKSQPRPAPRRTPQPGRDVASALVRQTLESYATRGIFRAYGAQLSAREGSRFSFQWHANATFTLVYAPSRRELTFRDLLPGVEGRSRMYRDLRAFVTSRTAPTLPEHRRIDPRKARVAVRNRHGRVSLVVSLRGPHLEYGVRKAVNLVHEVFVDFLRNPLYFTYMVEHFQLDPDL